mmetsp:Transcript_16222/g.32862  ORF Transcript_16222/g.32862 Transcript_16222/m.32862 type:complete len:226 (+) Transcript_16222:867-1544(+)
MHTKKAVRRSGRIFLFKPQYDMPHREVRAWGFSLCSPLLQCLSVKLWGSPLAPLFFRLPSKKRISKYFFPFLMVIYFHAQLVWRGAVTGPDFDDDAAVDLASLHLLKDLRQVIKPFSDFHLALHFSVCSELHGLCHVQPCADIGSLEVDTLQDDRRVGNAEVPGRQAHAHGRGTRTQVVDSLSEGFGDGRQEDNSVGPSSGGLSDLLTDVGTLSEIDARIAPEGV